MMNHALAVCKAFGLSDLCLRLTSKHGASVCSQPPDTDPLPKATANNAKSYEKYRAQTMNRTMPCASIRTHWLSVSGADLKTWSIGLQPAAKDTRTKYANITHVSQKFTCKDWLRSKLTSNNERVEKRQWLPTEAANMRQRLTELQTLQTASW